MNLSRAIYRALLHVYPAGFRTQFGEEMALDFEDLVRDVWRTLGWAGRLSFWITIGADIARTSLVQWFRTGLPALFLVSASWTTLVFGMIAVQFVPLQQRLEPSRFITLTAGESVVLLVMAVAAIPILIAIGAAHARS